MSLPMYGSTVTLKNPGTVEDTYGNKLPSWEPDADGYAEAEVAAHVQPDSSTEDRGAGERDQVVTAYRIWLDRGITVGPLTRIEWAGLVLDVDGQPERWPTHTELRAVVSSG